MLSHRKLVLHANRAFAAADAMAAASVRGGREDEVPCSPKPSSSGSANGLTKLLRVARGITHARARRSKQAGNGVLSQPPEFQVTNNKAKGAQVAEGRCRKAIGTGEWEDPDWSAC